MSTHRSSGQVAPRSGILPIGLQSLRSGSLTRTSAARAIYFLTFSAYAGSKARVVCSVTLGTGSARLLSDIG